MPVKLVIASLLKPVDDIRHFRKIALTLGQTSKYEINIIGFESKNNREYPSIHFHPIFKHRRPGFARFAQYFKYYLKLFQVKPTVLIVNTPELLIVSIAYKILFGSKLIYDIRENYKANFLYQKIYSYPIRHLLAYFSRIIEVLSSPFINHFILAERCYEHQLPFIGDRYTIIENKVLQSVTMTEKRLNPKSGIRLIFTGTIAEVTGVFRAIQLTNKISKKD